MSRDENGVGSLFLTDDPFALVVDGRRTPALTNFSGVDVAFRITHCARHDQWSRAGGNLSRGEAVGIRLKDAGTSQGRVA